MTGNPAATDAPATDAAATAMPAAGMLDRVDRLPVRDWQGPFPAELQARAVAALEAGRVVFLPELAFVPLAEEQAFLAPASAGEGRKNISLDPVSGALANCALGPADAPRLAAMLDRYARQVTALLGGLIPAYAGALERARTSFRPSEIAGRSYSPRHDDRLLHVDAFPSRPSHGRRILRVFANVAPDGAGRDWRVGEPFEAFVAKFFPRLTRPLPGSAWAMQSLGITRSRRSAYDHYMLQLHDRGKQDGAYQQAAPRQDVTFPAGCVWMCFTDQVLHAALAGHCALEQTFHLPVTAMVTPAQAPLRVLERLAGRGLV